MIASNEPRVADHRDVVSSGPAQLHVSISADQSSEIDSGVPVGFCIRYRIRSLLFNLFVMGLIAAICLTDSYVRAVLGSELFVIFLVYLSYAQRGGPYYYLASISSARDVSTLFERLHREPGQLFLKCECSHFYSFTSEEGLTTAGSETTFLNRTPVPIGLWTDVSEPVPDWTTSAEICKIKSEATFEFANPESAAFIDRFTALVHATHRYRDVHCKVTCELSLNGLAPRILMLPHHQPEAPWWLRPSCYSLSNCLLLNWPYRMLLQACTARVNICIRKRYEFNADTPCVVNMEDEREAWPWMR